VQSLGERFARQAGYVDGPAWAFRADICNAFPGFPAKVVVAKLASMIRRGLFDGCTCGCRGDFELTALGKAILEQQTDPIGRRESST
jgi:hypothetical protein